MITLSVVTAVLNGAATIAECLDSVASQSLPAEHVVADGGSSDGTPEIVARHGGGRVKVVAGPDRGIYDGMNRGIAAASGEIVGTLNADDLYADWEVLARVARAMEDPEVDACYGDLVYVRPDDTSRVVRYWKAGPFDPRKFFRGWMPPHPTFFVRRSCYERLGDYRLDMGTAADYELLLRFLLRHRLRAVYIPEVLVRMRAGGASNRSLHRRLEAHRMDRRAWTVNGLSPRPWTLALKPLSKVAQFVRRG